MQGRASSGRGRARETLALVGLAGSEHRPVRELSGGEQQRVALARAIAPEPRLLMLDEPLGALDRRLREHLADELRELFDRLDLTVLLVTHDHDEAFALGDRVAVMHDGLTSSRSARPSKVWRRPGTEFVARFLGWNVLRGPDGSGSFGVSPRRRVVAAPPPVRPSQARPGTVAARTFRRDHFRVRIVLDADAQVLEAPTRGVPPEAGRSGSVRPSARAVVTWPPT